MRVIVESAQDEYLIELPDGSTVGDLRKAVAGGGTCPAAVPEDALVLSDGAGNTWEREDDDVGLEDHCGCDLAVQRVSVTVADKFFAKASLEAQGMKLPLGVDVAMRAAVTSPDVKLLRLVVRSEELSAQVMTSVLQAHVERFSTVTGTPRAIGVQADIVETLFDGGADPNTRVEQEDDEAGYFAAWEAPTKPLLHVFLRLRSEALLVALLQQPLVNAEERDTAGDTALHYAVKNGFVRWVELLLDHGAMLDPLDHSYATPLVLAATLRNDTERTALVHLLLDRGASARLAVKWARTRSREDILSTLAVSGVDLDAYASPPTPPVMVLSAPAHLDLCLGC